MIPNINILGKEFSAYLILALVGVLVVLWFTKKMAEKHNLDDYRMLCMVLWAAVGVLIGSHMLYGFTMFDRIVYTFQNLHEIDSFMAFINRAVEIFGGAVFYGGLIGGVLVAFMYLRRHKLSIPDYGDAASPAIPLFHFFGRMGCFLSGCCFGVEWEGGVVYHYSMIEICNGVPRFPVQLIEAILNLLLFVLLLWMLQKGKMKGKLLPLYFSIYPVYRFILEYFRGDEYRGFLFGLSTSQLISVILLIIVAVYWIANAVKKKNSVSKMPELKKE